LGKNQQNELSEGLKSSGKKQRNVVLKCERYEFLIKIQIFMSSESLFPELEEKK
jgi:hypothetical protein